jgi:hypothetical protein
MSSVDSGSVVPNLNEDNMEERDDEYLAALEAESKPLAAELWENLTKEEIDLDILPFIAEIDNLEEAISEKSWVAGDIREVLSGLVAMQKEKSLKLREVFDVLVMVRLSYGKEIHSEPDTFKTKWLNEVFEEYGMSSLKIPELIAEVDDFGLSLLEKVFKAVESNFDDALEYFQSLNTSNLNREEKSKVLENFEDADFKNAMKKIVQARIEKELQKVELSEIPFDLMEGLYVAKWKSEEIFNIVTSSMQGLSKENGKMMVQKLFKCFEIASDYSFGYDELANVLEEVKRSLFRRNSGKTIELESIFHSRALKLFTKSQEKNVDELLSEIAELNEDLKLDLKKDFLSVKKALIRVQIDKEAKDLNKDDIKTWADQVKNHRIEPSKEQRIAVVVQASNLFNKYTARDVQVLALIMLYKSSIGTLAQINTGEGKTNIIAMLAVLYALEGKKVDIGELISNTVIIVNLTNCLFSQ